MSKVVYGRSSSDLSMARNMLSRTSVTASTVCLPLSWASETTPRTCARVVIVDPFFAVPRPDLRTQWRIQSSGHENEQQSPIPPRRGGWPPERSDGGRVGSRSTGANVATTPPGLASLDHPPQPKSDVSDLGRL